MLPSDGVTNLEVVSGEARIVVLVPTYNEADSIGPLLDQLLALGPNYCVLVVDDSSPDGTGGVVLKFHARYPDRVALLTRPLKNGIGRAYVAGFKRALATDADLIVTMDADLSHDPDDLVRLVAASRRADLVLGSRYVAGGSSEGWPAHRKLISWLGGKYARAVLGVPISDLTGGFKVYRRNALASLDLHEVRSDGYVFQIETTYKTLLGGFKVIEVPIRFSDRAAGKSKLSRRIVAEAFFVVWRLRLERLVGRRQD